ncbi:MAG: hypothetical protein ACTSSJ_01070 [Candidatus Odinarchaeia archaeon]
MRRTWINKLKTNVVELKEAAKLFQESPELSQLWLAIMDYVLENNFRDNVESQLIKVTSTYPEFSKIEEKLRKALNSNSKVSPTYLGVRINLTLAEYAKKRKFKNAEKFFRKSAYHIYLSNLATREIKAQLNLMKKVFSQHSS